MPSKVSLVVVHGIGGQKSDYADGFMKRVGNWGRRLGLVSDQVHYCPVHWADVLERFQTGYLKRASGFGLSYKRMRQLVVTGLGDAVSYQSRPEVHDQIIATLHRCVQSLPPGPRVYLGHSLGAKIIADYLRGAGRGPYVRGFVSMGANLPLFETTGDGAPVPVAEWINLYDRHDVLGYPLSPIGPAYERVRDIEVSVPGWLTRWNPASHMGYWKSPECAAYVASLLWRASQALP